MTDGCQFLGGRYKFLPLHQFPRLVPAEGGVCVGVKAVVEGTRTVSHDSRLSGFGYLKEAYCSRFRNRYCYEHFHSCIKFVSS